MEGGGNYTLGNRARITGCQKETHDSLRAPQDEFPWADRCKHQRGVVDQTPPSTQVT